MSDGSDNTFDAGAYWQERVVSGADLSVVGHRSMGPVYNTQIYERRIEVLEQMLSRHTSKAIQDLRVLDIGCGSGFYTGYWSARGVRDYVGVDISPATVQHLAEKFPTYEFINRDMTEPDGDGFLVDEPFDVVTVFDVFYHIVDDDRFTRAVDHAAKAIAATGCVLVMDQLCPERYQLSRHVVYRCRADYLATFSARDLELADDELLFHYLVPPLSGSRVVDLSAATVFKAAGFVLRLSGSLAARSAAALRRFDARQRQQGRRVSNSEMLVFKRPGVSADA